MSLKIWNVSIACYCACSGQQVKL